MKPASREFKRLRYLVVLLLFLFLFIPAMAPGEEASVPNNSIQRKSQLKTVIVDDYYPYTFVNKEGVPDGFSVDLVKAVAKVMGLDLEIKVDTWERARRHLETGEIDLLPKMSYSKEREKAFDFSVPHTIAFDAIFTRKDDKRLNTIEELKGQTVIVINGDQAHDYLLSSGIVDPEHLILVDSLPESLRVLSSGKADAALMPKLVGLTLMKDLNLTNLTQSAVVIESYNRPYSFAVKEGNLLLMERLSQGLSIVRKTGQYREIYDKWFGALEPKEVTLKSVLKYIVGLVLVLLLIGSAFALWSLSLRKQVALQTKNLSDEIVERKRAQEVLLESRQELAEIFSMSLDMICIADINTATFLKVNPAFTRILGYSEQELLNRSFIELIHHDDVTPTLTMIKERLQKGEAVINFVNRYLCKDGTYRWLEWISHPVPKRDITFAVAHDITERKDAEEIVRQSERRFRAYFESAPVGMAIIDQQRRFLEVNSQICNILGYSAEELAGRSFNSFTHPDDREGGRKRWQQLINGEVDFNRAEKRFIHKDGRVLWVIVSNTRIRDDQEKPFLFLSHMLDITDQKAALAEKKKLEIQLQQAQKFEAIGTLAGGIAHDFNNLLMGIQGRASLLSFNLVASHPHWEHIRAIEEHIKSASSLTRQLLGVARGGKYEVKPIDINELVLSSSTMFGRTKKEIQIHTKCHELSLTVEADRGQIEQVLLNMYVNAWQAMPPDGGDLYLETNIVVLDELYCKPHQTEPGRYVKISITDTGTGMDEATRLQIFDPFFTTKEKVRGTGLGLASAYGIIKNHGGMITVYSEIGHGTTFNIYLPISEKEVHREIPMDTGPIEGSGTILLVDDEEMIIEVGQAILESLGYRVFVSKRGQEAIETITNLGKEIDMVILDMIMPGMDGSTTFDRIREIQPDMPVLLSSGYAINGQAHDIMRRGCNGFIQKPYNISELSQKIRKVLDEVKDSSHA